MDELTLRAAVFSLPRWTQGRLACRVTTTRINRLQQSAMRHRIDSEEYFPEYELTDKGIILLAVLMKEAGLTPESVRTLGPRKTATALYRAQKRLRPTGRICSAASGHHPNDMS
jgi:hypothetical protein